jgi:two-component system sensor histidine kinase VanS
MSVRAPRQRRVVVSARLPLALSYAGFLVVAGAVALLGLYLVLRFIDVIAPSPGFRGAPFTTRRDVLQTLLNVSGLILAALAVLGVLGGWVIAGWVLRPMQRINRAAEIAATGRLDHRINLSGRNDEFRQLADTFDDMLDRLDDAFATQERFAANAAHELRTPLSVTATLLDVARANPEGQNYPELLERLQQTNARAIGLTEALLRLADANAISAVSTHVDLAESAREALAESADEAEQAGILLEANLLVAPVLGDPALLQQLVENLVQNAIRHNVSGGTAWVATGQETTGPYLRVENTGAAVYSAEQAARLREPFQRGAGRIREAGAKRGYGLGLALVARITDVHQGQLTIEPRPGGGLVATVTLPPKRRSRRAGIR